MNNWSKTKKILSLFSFTRYRKLIPNGANSSLFIRAYRWWEEQLTVTGKPIFTIWLLICIPATFAIGKPPFYICLVLGAFNFFNYLIAYFLVHLKVNINRNHSLSTHAGEQLSGFIELSNIGMTNLKDIEVFERELPLGITQPQIPYIADIKKNSTVKIPFTLHTELRGEYILKSIIVATSYPFGLIRKIKVKKSPQDIIIYPQILPIQLPKHKSGKSTSNNQQTKIYDLEQNEYVGNREYSFGDQFTAIDHKAWGRLGYPVTKIYQNDFDIAMGVIFIPTYNGIFDEDNFENAIKITTSIVQQLMIQKTNTSFLALKKGAIEIFPDIVEPDKVYEFLSLTKKNKISNEEFANALSEFSQVLNYFYIIGTGQLLEYIDIITKTIPEGANTNIILCTDQSLDSIPYMPENFNCLILTPNDLKKDSIALV